MTNPMAPIGSFAEVPGHPDPPRSRRRESCKCGWKLPNLESWAYESEGEGIVWFIKCWQCGQGNHRYA